VLVEPRLTGYGRRVPAKRFAVAHRAPANRAAATAFHEAGASVYEIDVQWSGRGLTVSHFSRLDWPLRWLERDRQRLRFARGLAQDPLLRETLMFLPADADVLFDLKDVEPELRAKTCALLEAEIGAVAPRSRWIVSATSADDVAMLRKAGFVGWLTARDERGLQAMLADAPDADGVSVRHTLVTSERVVRALHDRVPEIVAWTVNRVERARQLLQLGVDGITTDSLSVARAVSEVADE
jgi:glycerophosphoryl diester phosphodiesterase